jgi:hypothetical protein
MSAPGRPTTPDARQVGQKRSGQNTTFHSSALDQRATRTLGSWRHAGALERDTGLASRQGEMLPRKTGHTLRRPRRQRCRATDHARTCRTTHARPAHTLRVLRLLLCDRSQITHLPGCCSHCRRLALPAAASTLDQHKSRADRHRHANRDAGSARRACARPQDAPGVIIGAICEQLVGVLAARSQSAPENKHVTVRAGARPVAGARGRAAPVLHGRGQASGRARCPGKRAAAPAGPRAAACLWQSEEGLTCRLAHVLFKVL